MRLPLLFLLLLTFRNEAFAHVKWFTDGSYADKPLSVPEVVSNVFIWLLGWHWWSFQWAYGWTGRSPAVKWYRDLDGWFESKRSSSVMVMRIAAGMLFLLSWQGGAMLAPTLMVPSKYEWVGMFQFLLAFLLLFDKTVPYAGIGTIILYLLGCVIYDPFTCRLCPVYRCWLLSGHFFQQACEAETIWTPQFCT